MALIYSPAVPDVLCRGVMNSSGVMISHVNDRSMFVCCCARLVQDTASVPGAKKIKKNAAPSPRHRTTHVGSAAKRVTHLERRFNPKASLPEPCTPSARRVRHKFVCCKYEKKKNSQPVSQGGSFRSNNSRATARDMTFPVLKTTAAAAAVLFVSYFLGAERGLHMPHLDS